MMAITSLLDQLRRDEGVQRFPYVDTVGKITIGVGRNLSDVGLSDEEIAVLLQNDIAAASGALAEAFPWTSSLDPVRLGAVQNMTFNLGVGGLATFHDFLAKLQAGDYAGASQAMLQSQWAEQVGPRAQRLSIQIRDGVWQ
jgi:lysozyme